MKGGLGNQLFQYAAARRLAMSNDAELVIDEKTGFRRDAYGRSYMLDRFNIAGRLATPRDLMAPFGRFRLRRLRLSSRKAPFENRKYVEQAGAAWEPRLLDLEVRDWVYLEGYWQSERYFRDVQDTIRKELTLKDPVDEPNARLADEMQATNSVAIHLRWFDPSDRDSTRNGNREYYEKAIAHIEARVPGVEYFVFSDDIEAARAFTGLPKDRCRFVSHNAADAPHVDLWLMSRCKHFIVANSTFSWWGAWLSPSPDKIVVAPGRTIEGVGRWGFEGLIPDGWVTL